MFFWRDFLQMELPKEGGKRMGTKNRKTWPLTWRTWVMVMVVGMFLGGLQGAYGQTCPPGPGPASGQGMQVNNGCMRDIAGFDLVCTANDVRIASVANVVVAPGDSCAYPGDTVTFTADYNVLLTAQARHDIGIYFSSDGDPNLDGAYTGQCNINTLPYTPNPSPYTDLDGTTDPWPGGNRASGCQDWCGDIDDSPNPITATITVTAKCIDTDGDGKLNLPWCTSWRQPGDNSLCTSPLQAFPGAPSKCMCDTTGLTIPITVPPPALLVDKTVDANGDGTFSDSETIPESGGSVTYKVVVTNPSPPYTANITSLTDSVYGNITATGHDGITATTCSVPQIIPSNGGTYTCTFTVAVSGNPRTIVDTVTASGTDQIGRTLTGFDTAQVVVTPVAAPIELQKSAVPETVAEPGANVTFGFLVKNFSTFETVYITSLVDNIYGDLTAYAGTTCVIPSGGIVLGPQATYSCEITALVSANYGDAPHVNVASASGTDDDGAPVFDDDSATVTIANVPSAIQVTKAAVPSSLNEPGGPVTFTITVINKSLVDSVTVTSLVDSIHGDLNGQGTCSVPQTLQVGDGVAGGTDGDTYTCSFTANVTGDYGYAETDVVTASGTDSDGIPVSGSASATVTIADVVPDITIIKMASPTSVPETGGNVTFTFTVTNNSTVEAVTLTSLTDTVFGNLNGQGDCVVPQTIAAGGTYSCSVVKLVSGQAGINHYNVVTATGQDNEGNTDTATDDETITVIDVPPTVTLTKGASPATLPEPGGVFTFTLTINNTSAEPVTITALTDTNPLPAECTRLIGTTLAAGASASCTYQVTRTEAGTYPNTANVTVQDNENNQASASAGATVSVTNVSPSIAVQKDNDANGDGTFSDTEQAPYEGAPVPFRVTITNNSVEAVTISTIGDDKFDVGTACKALIGTSIPAGGSVFCTFAGTAPKDPLNPSADWIGLSQIDTVSVTASDNEGGASTASDSSTVTTPARGKVVISKTLSDGSLPEGFAFQIRRGASLTSVGTTITSGLTDAAGSLTFQWLLPSTAAGDYQLCEANVLPGWTSSLRNEAGAFMPPDSPGAINGVGNFFVPGAVDPLVDNSFYCVPFTLDAEEQQTFTVVNSPPPGGDGRTIGYWKNWSSCTGGGQDPVLDETLAASPLTDTSGNHGVWIGNLFVNTCQEGVAILNKSTLSGTKMANDAAYELASQMLAAQLNAVAGARNCTELQTLFTQAQNLLVSIGFNGTGKYLDSKVKTKDLIAKRDLALNYAKQFDNYNNNLVGSLCYR